MSFTHPAAPRVIKSGLFEGIDHFRDLEDRISSLSGEGAENEKGAVFEVFAEAALKSLSEIQAKHVWGPVSVAPLRVRKKLNLRARDKGVDGIIETLDGRLITYQVKFRSGRPTLTWDDLGNFMAYRAGPTTLCCLPIARTLLMKSRTKAPSPLAAAI